MSVCMLNEKNTHDEAKVVKERRVSSRRKAENRRSSVRFGDALGRRGGHERRTKIDMKHSFASEYKTRK